MKMEDIKNNLNIDNVKNLLNKDNIMTVLDTVYTKAVDGIPVVSPTIEELAESYLKKTPDNGSAAKKMLNYQIAKCTTSGIITGFGGLITLPVAVPANITSVLYVQMRMIACTAYLGGYDIHDDQVQTFVYACLAGVSVNAIAKKFGVRLGEKLAMKGIEKIPGKVLIKLNQKLGFRFATKFGETGFVNLGKLVPGVGAAINGGFDLVETKIIANRAYKMFIKNDFSVGARDPEFDEIILEQEENVSEDAESQSTN